MAKTSAPNPRLCFCKGVATTLCSWKLRSGPAEGKPCGLKLCALHGRTGLCAWHQKLTGEKNQDEKASHG